MGLFLNKMTYLLFSSSFMNLLIQIFINKVLISYLYGKTPVPVFAISGVVIFLVYFIYAILLSINTSQNKCGKSYKPVYIYEGVKTGLTMSLSYILLIFIPYFKQPFIDIGGDTENISLISEIFYMNFINIIMSIENYYNSQFEGCKLSDNDMMSEIKKIEKKLNKNKYKRIKKVEIKP